MPTPWPEALLGALVGSCTFLLVVGPGPVLPSNIAWLQGDDRGAHLLAWLFFASSGWGWPLSANPSFGLELAGSVYYADVLPLFALPAKLFARFGAFQYFGLWLLLSFVLQGVFAYCLVRSFIPSRIVCTAAAAIFCFAPMFLSRLPMHMALGGHWILLAGLWLNLGPERARPATAWGALLGVAALTHSYLLAMSLALWVPDLLRRSLRPRPAPRQLGLEAAAVTAVVIAALWLGGLFPLSGGGLSAHGFGIYRANILTMLDSNSWSYLLPSLPGHHGEYEGFAFLGSGILLVIAAAMLAWRRIPLPWAYLLPRWPLALALMALSLLALSHRWALGPILLIEIPLPESALAALGLFRSSGRFIWPLAYAVMLAAVVALASAYQGRRLAVLVMAAALLQVSDTSAGWSRAKDGFDRSGPEWSTPLASDFWHQAASHYRRLRIIPPGNRHGHYEALAYLAVRHGMMTDAVYLRG